MLVTSLIMATERLLAVLLLHHLRFPPWQYGLALAVSRARGLIGSRPAAVSAARYGHYVPVPINLRITPGPPRPRPGP